MKRHPKGWSLAVAVTLIACCMPGCSCSHNGDVYVDEAVVERLPLAPARERPTEKPSLHRQLLPPDDVEPWEVEAKKAFVAEDPASGKRGLILHGRDEAKQILIPGDFDPRKFNQVVLQLSVPARDTVTILCRREGRPLKASLATTVEASEHPEPVVIDLPQLRQLRDPFDQLLIQIKGDAGPTFLGAVDLIWKPEAEFLPPYDGEGGLVEVDGELRRGFGLSSEYPLTAEFEAITGGQLVFSYGSPRDMRVPNEAPTLTVTLGADRLERRQEFELERDFNKASRWRESVIDLADFVGRPVHVTFELAVEGEHEGFSVIAEARQRARSLDPPTVLLITSDTHRADHMGTSGPEPLVHTPTLDALAQRGVLFENCYSSTNVTNPSHVALMTALHPRDTHIINNHAPLKGSASTLAERFHAAGYRTFAALSASHLVHNESGLGQGFDRMSAPHRPDRDAVETISILDDWLGGAAGEPLFVWLHVFDAHAPYGPPDPFARRYYDPDKDPYDQNLELQIDESLLPKFLEGLRDVDFPYAEYRAEVDYLDSQLRRILPRQRFEEGIVVFTADHGESFGQHGVYWDHAGLYPQTVHIPLILSYPGAPVGTRISAPVNQTDIGRTLLDLAGLEDAEFGGRDLRWVLDAEQMPETRFLISAHGFTAAMNTGDWHLVFGLRRHALTGIDTHQVQLFDLRTDPWCEHDLVQAGQELERAGRMRAKLLEWLAQASSEGLGSVASKNAAALEALEALGYATSVDDAVTVWYEPACTCEWCARFEE